MFCGGTHAECVCVCVCARARVCGCVRALAVSWIVGKQFQFARRPARAQQLVLPLLELCNCHGRVRRAATGSLFETTATSAVSSLSSRCVWMEPKRCPNACIER